jgi:hypothetical protein
MRKTETISPKVRNETRVPTLSPLLFNILLQYLARAIRQDEEVKGIQIGKKVVKPSLKDLINSTQKLLGSINSISKVVVYKINLQKSVAFLYTKGSRLRKNIE